MRTLLPKKGHETMTFIYYIIAEARRKNIQNKLFVSCHLMRRRHFASLVIHTHTNIPCKRERRMKETYTWVHKIVYAPLNSRSLCLNIY